MQLYINIFFYNVDFGALKNTVHRLQIHCTIGCHYFFYCWTFCIFLLQRSVGTYAFSIALNLRLVRWIGRNYFLICRVSNDLQFWFILFGHCLYLSCFLCHIKDVNNCWIIWNPVFSYSSMPDHGTKYYFWTFLCTFVCRIHIINLLVISR